MSIKFINLTPHPISLPGHTIAPSGKQARVEPALRIQSSVPVSDTVSIDLADTTWGQILGLPGHEPGVYLIVSNIVVAAAHAAGRRLDDLLVPGGQRRDDSGRIVGCTCLTTGRSSLPGAGLQLRPAQIAVFGGAARWAAMPAEDKWSRDHMPRDIDAVYAGIDRDEAEHQVRLWAGAMGLSDRIPLDLHHSPRDLGYPGSTKGLAIPRPAALPGEDGTVPLDTAWSRVLGEAPVSFDDRQTLGALFRRLGRIAEVRGRDTLPGIVRQTFADGRAYRLSLDTSTDITDEYREGTLGAARRAYQRLGDTGPWLLEQLADLPVAAHLRIILRPGWVPSDKVLARAYSGAGEISPSRRRGTGVLYVSDQGAMPGYPDASHRDPAWLTEQGRGTWFVTPTSVYVKSSEAAGE